MEIREDTWQLASTILTEHGKRAMSDVRGLCETVRKPGRSHKIANYGDIIRAMDLILSQDDHGTIH